MSPGAGGTSFAILGSLEVLRDGVRITPKSAKLRTLLVDLLVHHGQARSTDRLIDDLWGDQPPGTAVGVLQNYVSQLRTLLGADLVRRSGGGYLLDITDSQLDRDRFVGLLRDAHAAAGPDARSAKTRDALALWRGEALADVATAAFAQAEITRLRELRAAAMELLFEAELARGNHRDTIAALEAALAEHPLRERLWALLMTALYRSGRQADALRAYQRARSSLLDELGIGPGPELRELEQAVLQQRVDPAPGSRPRRPRRGAPDGPALTGRVAEVDRITRLLREPTGMLLLTGEPGIGKTRLLEEAQAGHPGVVIAGRAYEAERGRPYGAWVDALRAAALPELPAALRGALAPLLPELSDAPGALEDTMRLYDAVVVLVTHLAERAEVLVVLDDLQWLDERSVALLHFVLRQVGGRVPFLASARSRELADNRACARSMESLRRLGLLQDLRVGPLPGSSIDELAHSVAPGADLAAVVSASNGNPLFAIEMARAAARGDDPVADRVDALIGDRLGRLSEAAAALVPFMAAFGRSAKRATLAAAIGRDADELVDPLAELEQHGVLVADGDTYDFAHDLIRVAGYRRLSTPRRAMLHGRIGRALNAEPDPDDILAADAARHADAAGDSATCAAASVRAARRCLRLLAYDEAAGHVEVGRAHARRLEPRERIGHDVRLVDVLVHPGLRLRDPGTLGADLAELCALARQLGMADELSTGLTLLARLHHWVWGDIPRAGALLRRAVEVIELSEQPVVEPLLQGARCLAYLEIDMPRTRTLFGQLAGLGELAEASHQYHWGRALVLAWTGDLPEARTALREAIALAEARHDHWAAFECTARLALLEIETGNAPSEACERLAGLAGRLGQGGSEAAYAQAIGALAGGRADFPDRVDDLVRIGARILVPDLLGLAAESRYRDADLGSAEELARRALDCASAVHRANEAARAHGLLACIAARRGLASVAAEHLAACEGNDQWSARVRALHAEAEDLISANKEAAWP